MIHPKKLIKTIHTNYHITDSDNKSLNTEKNENKDTRTINLITNEHKVFFPLDVIFYLSQFMGLKNFLLFTSVNRSGLDCRKKLNQYGINIALFESKNIKKLLKHPKLSTEIQLKELSYLYPKKGKQKFKHAIANQLYLRQIKIQSCLWNTHLGITPQKIILFSDVEEKTEKMVQLETIIKNLKTTGHYKCDTIPLCEAFLNGLTEEEAIKVATVMEKYPNHDINYKMVTELSHLSEEAIDQILIKGASVFWKNVNHYTIKLIKEYSPDHETIKGAVIALCLGGLCLAGSISQYWLSVQYPELNSAYFYPLA